MRTMHELGPTLRRSLRSGLIVAILLPGPFLAQQSEADDLTEWSLEDLMDIEITSVAKKGQRLSDAAAAVYVVTAEDIRRSGLTSIPEALRMVPGVHVAHIDADKWAITARGFNGRYAGKMLVLVDGRSVYSPLFAGVYWDAQDTLLEDLDRIEVIRGPGATLWGANAVTGVINIITKPASESTGELLTVLAGNEEVNLGFRHGGTLGDNGHYRVYAKYIDRDSQSFDSGQDADDAWDSVRAGFRADWSLRNTDAVTLLAEIHDATSGQTSVGPLLVPPYQQIVATRTDFSGANLLARWNRTTGEGRQTSLQVYADRTERDDAGLLSETRDTFDVDFQHRFPASARQELVWGVGYRHSADEIEDTFFTAFDPDRRNVDLWSAFLQDEISLHQGRTRLTVGSKFEHNDFTGFEIQPNIRAIHSLGNDRSIWAAVSRAVRSPSRIFHDVANAQVAFPDPMGMGPTILVRVAGDPNYDSEELTAIECGFRFKPSDALYVDLAAFYNDYSKLTSLEPDGLPVLVMAPIPHLEVRQVFRNSASGESYGLEAAANWRVSAKVNLFASYSYIDLELATPPTATTTFDDAAETPVHQAQLRGAFDLDRGFSLDLALYYTDDVVSGMPGGSLTGGATPVDSYTRLDARFGWQPKKTFEAFLVLQNLLDDQHREFGADLVIPTEVDRSIHGGVTWRF